jgi:hypothetical protein
MTATLQAFPFLSTMGEVALHLLSQAGVFIYSSHSKWTFPPPVEFSSHRHFFKLSCSWLLGGCRHSCLPWGIAPPALFAAQGAPSSLLHVFFVVVAYYSVLFFFFPWVGVGLSRGYADLAQGCLWEYQVTLSSPGGLHLPKQSGAGIWWRGSPPGFSI